MNGSARLAALGVALALAGVSALAVALGVMTLPQFFNPGTVSGIAVALAGIALMFAAAPGSMRRLAQLLLGAALLAMSVIGYFAAGPWGDIFSASTGEALAIALMGATLIAFHVGRAPVVPAQASLAAMAGAALLGLIGYLLNLDALYRGFVDLRLAPLLALAILAFAVGLWSQSHRMGWHRQDSRDRDDRRIPLISGAILLGIAVCAGLAGFALMAKTTQEVLTDSLTISLEHRLRSFQDTVDNGYEHVRLASTRPRFNALMAKHVTSALTEAESSEVQKILDDVIKNTPIVALVVTDNRGRIVARRGELVREPPFQVPLADRANTQLLWKDGTMLRSRMAIRPKGEEVGVLEADLPLPAIDRLFRDFGGLGQSGTMGVCAAWGEGIICMPSRANKFRVIQAPRLYQGKPVPMTFALANQSGVAAAIDVHGESIYSAYGPIGKTGLGMIVKVHTSELYRPVGNQFAYTLGAISIVVFVGIVLLRWQITPLARNLVAEVNERKRAEERFAHLAHHDSLTNLPNRVLFHDRLRQAMTEAQRRRHAVAVMFLDVDRFKAINDTLGHDAGDDLLKQIAVRLAHSVRAGDTVSRLAGDEFALVLPGMEDVQFTRHLAQRLIDAFSQPFTVQGQEVFVTASVGITLYPADAESVEGLLKNADTAMYRAKDSGRNNFQFYSAELHAQAIKRLSLENQLRGAIERNELILHYQPVVDLKSGKVSGMEALLRWNHPQLGLVPPLEFITLAEESGLIVPIGRWVLHTACAQARAWQDAGIPPLRLSVNISLRQFQRDLPDTVSGALRAAGLDSRYLQLELTESVMMHNAEAAVATLHALDRTGVRLSLDDFGTGYSSLSYLKRFPIDSLKIDRSFVRDVPNDSDDTLITTAIINLARSLDIEVVAEGVETATQLTFLRRQHCDEMQGYLFSKPLPPDEFERLVRDGRTLADCVALVDKSASLSPPAGRGVSATAESAAVLTGRTDRRNRGSQR